MTNPLHLGMMFIAISFLDDLTFVYNAVSDGCLVQMKQFRHLKRNLLKSCACVAEMFEQLMLCLAHVNIALKSRQGFRRCETVKS